MRQSFVVLQALGFVDVRQGEGVFLRRTRGFGDSLAKLLERRRRLPDVLEAREALEVKLAELAATHRGHEDLAAMRDALSMMEAEIEAGGLGTEGDSAFHHAIALAARNQVLLHLIDAMAEVIQESRVESLSEPGRPPRSLEAHARILSAIESQSAQAAAAAMRQHLQVVADVSLLQVAARSIGRCQRGRLSPRASRRCRWRGFASSTSVTRSPARTARCCSETWGPTSSRSSRPRAINRGSGDRPSSTASRPISSR